MGFPLKRVLLSALVLVCLCEAQPRAERAAVTPLLDRYAAGDFDALAAELERADYNDILKSLRREAPVWIDAGGSADRMRRTLAAVTFALEAARAGTFDDWKLVQRWMRLESIYWKAPPQLIEWGCELLRSAGPPTEAERLWHLAALTVADRAGDFEFLIGSPFEARANPKDEILHLEHAAERFPDERRFALAQGIAIEWRLFPNRRSGSIEVQQIFDSLKNEPGVGPEASVRLGLMLFRSGSLARAMALFRSADERSREPYVVYLARFFEGQVHERQKHPAEAEQAYRDALAVIPGAQSATFALSALLADRGSRAEAAAFIDAALTTDPQPADPWREYGAADARFWPDLIARLHQEIRQ